MKTEITVQRRATSQLRHQRDLTHKFWIIRAVSSGSVGVLWPSSSSLEGFLTSLHSLEAECHSARYGLKKLNVFFLPFFFLSWFVFFCLFFGKWLYMFLFRTQPFCLSVLFLSQTAPAEKVVRIQGNSQLTWAVDEIFLYN